VNYPKTYTADDFNRNAAPIPLRAEVEKKINALVDFGFVHEGNETAVRAWLLKFKNEAAMTCAPRPLYASRKPLMR
jgi:hypothetical protein